MVFRRATLLMFALIGLRVLPGQMVAPVSSPTNSPRAANRRVALSIGNDLYYPDKPLTNAVNDASAMHKALADSGYQVALATNTTLSQMETAISAFLNSVQSGDVALVYYAGHGFQVEGENYFVPTDFTASDPATAKTRAVPMSRITDGLRARGVHAGILIADACRNNPFSATRSVFPGLAAMSGGAGLLIGLATHPGGVASDKSSSGHGLYTQALLDNLKRPGLNIDQIFSAVSDQVSRESKGAQVPWTGSALRGITPFAAPSALADSPSPVPVAQQPGFPLPASFLTSPNRVINPAAPRQSVAPMPELGVPGDADSGDLFAQIDAQIREGDANAAEISLGAAKGGSNFDYRAPLYLGKIRLLQGRYQDALEQFNLAIQKAPLSPTPLYLRAISYAVLGQYEAALSDTTIALTEHPEDKYFLMIKANLSFVTGHYVEAVSACDNIISQDSSLASAYLIRGHSKSFLGDRGAADSDYVIAARLQSKP